MRRKCFIPNSCNRLRPRGSEQTSKGILDKFKEFRDDARYADFWAPGYLVLVGEKPHPQSIIDEFIKMTRQQQKLSRQDT